MQSIIGQQISVAAANSVFLKFKKNAKVKLIQKCKLFKFYDLKKCGLSKQKVKGIRELKKFLDKSFNPAFKENE